jgi:hypothetical protein
MSAPKVLFDNYITQSNVTVDSEAAGFPIEGAVNTLTYEFWKFETDNAQVDITYTGTANALGIVIEDLLNCTISVYSSNNGVDYTLALAREFLRNGAYLIPFDAVSGNYFRIILEKATASDGIVRNIMLGETLEFEKCLMGSHAPIPYQRSTDFISNISGGGNFLGRSSRRKGFANSFEFKMISKEWGRDELQSFVVNCQDKAYYIAWNDELYPDECALGWTDNDIPLSYTGDAGLMETRWNMRALATGAGTLEVANYLLTEDGNLFLTEDGEFLLAEGF